MKKLLCTLLAVAMLASVMAIAVIADETTAGGETGPVGFQYPTYETIDQLPTTAPGPGLKAVVIMKPDETLEGTNTSYLRFIFTPDIDMMGYNCHWGIGSVLPEDSDNPGKWQFYMGDGSHYLGSTYNYGTGEYFKWFKDSDGCTIFQNIISIFPNADGKFVDGDGNEYDSQYDMAKAGQLIAMIGEHQDGSGTGLQDGYQDNDWNSAGVHMWSNFDNNQIFGGFDATCVRVTTEEDYYNEDGSIKDTQATVGLAVVHGCDGTTTTLNGKPASKMSFVFKGWEGNGYECMWHVGLLPKTADDNTILATRPAGPDAEGINWYNFDNDEDVLINGTQTNTTWAMGEWKKDANGDTIFTVLFQIPEAEIEAAGWKDMEDAAFNGGLVARVGEHQGTAGDGYIDSDATNGKFKANTAFSNGHEAIVMGVVSGVDYYGEEHKIPGETDAPTDEPNVTEEPDESKPGESEPTESKPAESKPADKTEEGGCASVIGASALILAVMAAAPVAFARKKD